MTWLVLNVNDMAGAIDDKILYTQTIQQFWCQTKMLVLVSQSLELFLKLLVIGP